MKAIVTMLVCFLFSCSALAGGDKNRHANQILDSDGCVLSIPAGLDADDCEEVTAPEQSGIRLFVCNGEQITLICADDD